MHAYVFPGQGAQFVGMGKDLYDNVPPCKELFEKANEILGFPDHRYHVRRNRRTAQADESTQPAIFLHSVILAKSLGADFKPEMTAGHSLGEFSALVAAGALSFEDGLSLVSKRAMAMQKACEQNPSTMAAIIGLPDATVEEICSAIDGVVVPANYNCPGQLVISGSNEAIDAACAKLTGRAPNALKLNVGGAFHSPLMEPARVELEAAIKAAPFAEPVCPIYQNVDAKPYTDPAKNPSQPDRPTDLSGALDTDRAKHDRRRSHAVHRTRPRQRIAGPDQESGPAPPFANRSKHCNVDRKNG